MRTINFEENELTVMAIFKEKTRQETVVLDSYGKMVVAECNHRFDENVKEQIHAYVKNKERAVKENNETVARLEHYQKFYVSWYRSI